MQHCGQTDTHTQNGIFPKECLPQKRNLNERRRKKEEEEHEEEQDKDEN